LLKVIHYGIMALHNHDNLRGTKWWNCLAIH
jgi:hypothetical protein